MPKEIIDTHFKIETAKRFVEKGLKKYIHSEEKISKIISRYDNNVIIETGAQLQSAFNSDETDDLKNIKIPKIKTKILEIENAGSKKREIMKYSIEDASPVDYPFISPLMGMIVNCCAYPCGSGSMLCQAVKNSPWFKLMLIKKDGEVQGLTVVCADTSEKNLVILGLETQESNLSANKKKIFKELIDYSAKEMLANSNYEKVLFSAGGVGLPNIGFGSKTHFKNIGTYEQLSQLVSSSNLTPINTEENNFKIKGGAKYGFDTLLDIPESAICIELSKKERHLNRSNGSEAQIRATNNLNFNKLGKSDSLPSLTQDISNLEQKHSEISKLLTLHNLQNNSFGRRGS